MSIFSARSWVFLYLCPWVPRLGAFLLIIRCGRSLSNRGVDDEVMWWSEPHMAEFLAGTCPFLLKEYCVLFSMLLSVSDVAPGRCL